MSWLWVLVAWSISVALVVMFNYGAHHGAPHPEHEEDEEDSSAERAA